MTTTGEQSAERCQCGGNLTEHMQQLVVDLNAPNEPLKGRAFVTRSVPTCIRCRKWHLTPEMSEKIFVEARAQLATGGTAGAHQRAAEEASRRAIEEVSQQRLDWDRSIYGERDERLRREEQERLRRRNEEEERQRELDQAAVARARALGRTGIARTPWPVNEISVKATPRLESRCVARKGYSALAFQEEGAFIRLRPRPRG